MSIYIVNTVLNCLQDWIITGTHWSYFRQEQTIWIWQLVGNWEQSLQFYLKNKSITPTERQCVCSFQRAQLKSLKLHCFKTCEDIRYKGPVLNIDKRNSRRAAVVHKKTKSLSWGKGLCPVKPTTQDDRVWFHWQAGNIRKLTWHWSFMQTDLTYPH